MKAASGIAMALATLSGLAQEPGDQIVALSQFEVTTTQGHGYVATNAATALKTNESVMDMPQGVEVMSRDLIDDIGNINTTDTLQFFGVSDGFAGESNAIRGVGVSFAYVDDMPENQFVEDNAIVDSFQVIKGPAQVLYLNARLTGLVLRLTKKPLPYRQEIVTAQVNDWGQYRFTGDFAGPIGAVGGAKIDYRVVLARQGGGNWQDNVKDDRTIAFGAFDVALKNTTMRVAAGYQDIFGITGGKSVLTPSGQLYTGAGRDVTGQLAGGNIWSPATRFSAHFLQHISENWDSRFQASIWSLLRYGGTATPSSVNWATGSEAFQPQLDNIKYSYWTVMEDIHGRYHLGALPNQDAFGFAYSDFNTKTEVWSTAGGAVNLPIANAAAINAYQTPQWSRYSPPANEGTDAKTVFGEMYWTHTIEAIPRWLDLVGGWTWDYSASTSVTNISTLPWTSALAPVEQFVHRLGIVFKPLPGVSLYAIEATSFTPAAGSSVVASGQLAPPQTGEDDEVGIKTSLFDGKLSTDFAYFQMPVANVLRPGGVNSQGVNFFVPIGFTHEEGVDGDAAFALLPGWQLVVNFYAGHDRDQNNQPVAQTFDNELSFFTRYDFTQMGPLRGLAIGGGLARVGGRWIATTGLTGVALPASGALKAEEGTLVDAFFSYAFNRHLSLRVACDNILDQAYAYGSQGAIQTDPSPPRTWYFLAGFKY